MRGYSMISAVIFLAIAISAVFIIYQAGVPIIKKMQTAAAIERMQDVMSRLDEIIMETVSEGKGSKRTFSMKIDSGDVQVNSTEDAIYWELKTDVEVISPRTSQRIGNIIVGSNLETRGYEGNYTFSSPETESYIMENEHLKVFIKKIGSVGAHANINSNSIMLAIFNKNTGTWLNNTGFLDFSVDFNSTSQNGTGYTSLVESGYNLPYGTVVAYMNTSYSDYFANFTLYSGADFVEIVGYA